MSECVVKVCKIEKIVPHENAERLELAIIGGWCCVVPKGRYQAGNLVVYVPPDSLIPRDMAYKLGVEKYAQPMKDEEFFRIRCAKLRGKPSFGLIVDPDSDMWPEGMDVREHYGIKKYTPPPKMLAGDQAPDAVKFFKYTDIENLRNFPEVFGPGEWVIATEKIHGTNCRIGYVDGEVMCGSHRVRRKRPTEEEKAQSIYWWPFFNVPGIWSLLSKMHESGASCIVYGEIYGKGVQALTYGQEGMNFAAFDIRVHRDHELGAEPQMSRYLDHHEFTALCGQYDIPTVPVVYRGEFDLDMIKKVADQRSAVAPNFVEHISEGVVVRPLSESTSFALRDGRKILKYISDAYLLSKSAEEDTTDA